MKKKKTHELFDTISSCANNPQEQGIKSNNPFVVGQLVLVLKDESQFRIDGVIENGEKVLYHSNKFNKDFEEKEIEDFEHYWKRKK